MSGDVYLATHTEVRTEEGRVILETAPVHNVRGFTLSLSPDAAKKLGYKLIGEFVRSLPPTCGGSGQS